MAVAFDSVTASAEVTTGTTVEINHTAGGSDRVVVVEVLSRFFGDPAASVPTSATYGGVAMTLIDSQITAFGHDASVTLFALAAPATGSQPVVVSWADAANGPRYAVATSFSGGDQSTPIESSAKASNVGTTVSVDVTVTTPDSMVVDGVYHEALHGGVFAAGAGQTERFNAATSNADAVGVSTEPAASPGTVTMSWTANNDVWAQVAVVVKAAAGGGGSVVPVIVHHLREQGVM